MRTSVVALLLLACIACTHTPHEPSDLAEARSRYFVERRAFPFDAIPDGARREALEAWRRTRRAASESAGSWRPVGSAAVDADYPFRGENGRITAIAISPADPRTILIGGSGGGIFRSIDGGATFAPVTDDQADLSVGDIAFATGQIVYAGMGDSVLGLALGSGVLRSDDAGATWRHISTGSVIERGTIRRVLTDPNDPEHLLVAQRLALSSFGSNFVAGGILESHDGGRTWFATLHGVASSLARINATTVVAGVTPQISRSTDNGAHWTPVWTSSPPATEIVVASTPLDSSLVYAAASSSTQLQILASHDGGVTWQTVATSGMAFDSFPFGYLAVSPSDPRTLFRGISDLWRSTDGGAHWTNVTNDYDVSDHFTPDRAMMHADQHAIAFGSDGTTWLSNDGGLYTSRDEAQTFTFAGPFNTSLIELYGLGAHPLDGSRIYGATQDNGLVTNTGGGAWFEARTGDYGTVLFDPNNPQHLMTNYVYGHIDLCDAAGSYIRSLATNATFGEADDSRRIAFIAPLVENRAANAVYFATWRLFVSHNFGLSWQPTAGTTDLTRGNFDNVSAIGVSEENANAIYTGSSQGRVMRSGDGGTTWNDVTGTLPQRAVSSIAIAGDGTNAWVSLSGYHSGHIYRTTDGGATWSRIDAGVPDVPVNTLFFDSATLWAGTDAGAFRMTGDGGWVQEQGIPPVIVMAFARTADGRLLAATHGRGVYEFVPPAPAPQRRRSAPH